MFFDVDQGKKFLKRRKIKTERSKIMKEGFQDNTSEYSLNFADNSNQDSDTQIIADLDLLENDFNQKLADYVASYQILMDTTNSYIASTDNTDLTKNKNVYVNRTNDPDQMTSTRVGCFNTNDAISGLEYQSDLGMYNIPVTADTCKVRAADLGYEAYSLRGSATDSNASLCYAGASATNAVSPGIGYKYITAYSFATKAGAGICTLLYTGQIGLWNTSEVNIFDGSPGNETAIGQFLQIDPNTPSGNGDCHITHGGALNTDDIVASYGLNCSAPFPDLPYQLKGVNSYYCLFNNTNGDLTTMPCNADDNEQLWKFIPYNNSYLLQNVNTQTCLYNNADGRFNTYSCVPQYNDQLWNISNPDPNSDAIQLQDVNSNLCLYNNSNGNFGTFTCESAYNDQWWSLLQYGGNTGNPTSGNWSGYTTDTIVSKDGYWPISSNYTIGAEADPAPGCGKYYQSWYQCANAPAKQINVNWESTGYTVDFDCTDEVATCQNFAFYVNDSGMITINNTITGAFIWSVNVANPNAVANVAYSAQNSKYGRFFIKAGESLEIGDFIGSPAGLYHAILVNDPATNQTGLQVRYCLYNCSDTAGNDETANVVYQINPANSGVVGKVGFINNATNIQEYPSEMIQPSADYDMFGNYDSQGHDLLKISTPGLTSDDCKTQCSANASCGGFVYSVPDTSCYLKDAGMFPIGLRQPDANAELYVRSKMVTGDDSCPKTISQSISAVEWSAIPVGDNMQPSTLCKLGAVAESDREDVYAKNQAMTLSAEALEDKLDELINNDTELTNALKTRVRQLKKDLRKYDSMRNIFTDNDNVTEGMTNYMQENESKKYKYLLISVLALLFVGAIIKVFRK